MDPVNPMMSMLLGEVTAKIDRYQQIVANQLLWSGKVRFVKENQTLREYAIISRSRPSAAGSL
jgi:hypothetical protein